MSIWLVIVDVLAISVLVDWITFLITKKQLHFSTLLATSVAIYYMWWIIATGGIIRC